MRERASQLGGRVKIQSRPNAGTRIEVELPRSDRIERVDDTSEYATEPTL
jgi:chemotaxis protein histidine kinase CheA